MAGWIRWDTIRRRTARLLFIVSTAAFIYCVVVVIPYAAFRADRLGLIPGRDPVPRHGGLWNHVGELETFVDEAITTALMACLLALLSRTLGERVDAVYLIVSMLLVVIVFFMGGFLVD